MSDDTLQATSALVREEFGLENTPAPGSEEELLSLLADRIAEMLERRPEYLMSMLYRLDVLEEKIHPVMRPDAPEPANWGLARLVLERQKERIETKRSVKTEPLKDMKDWEW
jgi:hypothetical protein